MAPTAVASQAPSQARLLEVRGLTQEFRGGGVFGASITKRVLNEVSFTVDRGETVALVGQSGSGKSTVARALLRLVAPRAGQILLEGEDVLASEPKAASLRYRGRVQMIFQDPFASLNPVHTVLHHLERPLLRHGRATPADAREKACALLDDVGLSPSREMVDRHPYELSGGQRQRVAIARALAVQPQLLVADEPTSMLDVSIRVGVLNLLGKLVRERGLGLLLITHDLVSARALADRVVVLYQGRVVEQGAADEVIERPQHEYTRALLSAIADPIEAPRA